jgi:hypothetical protein
MDSLLIFFLIIAFIFGLVVLIGYIYVFNVLVNMQSTSGKPFLKVETNLQAST